MKQIHFIVLVAVIMAIELGLILVGTMTPLTTNSSGNLLFSLVVIAVVFYMGWMFSKHGLRKAAINGALAMFAGTLMLYMFAFVGHSMNRPVIGISVPDTASLVLALLILTVSNIALGVLFAVAGAWIGKIFSAKKKKKL